MKRKLTIIFSVLALVLVASVAFGVRGGGFSRILADVLNDVPGKVDIFAKDNQNHPLGGVSVNTSLDNDSYFYVGMTDDTGHLIFNEPDFTSRTRYFKVDFPMYSSSPEVVQVNTAKNTTRNANFVLTPISGTGSVSGKITIYNPGGADNGNPLSSATVRIINSTGSEKGRTTSAADGRYQINNIPEGTGYAVYASKSGYEQNSRQGINIVANQTLQDQNLGLVPSARPSPSPRASPSASASASSIPQTARVDLNVRVFDASTNKNISGLPVILDSALTSSVEKITNLNQYNAVFADVQAGRHTLSVNPPSHPNYNSKYEYKFVAALEVKNEVAGIPAGQDGRQYLEVGLSQRSAYEILTVIGKITDESSNPISGARVKVFCSGDDLCGLVPQEGISSSSFNRIDRKPEYEYNYLIRNVYNAPRMINRSLRVVVEKDGYILDTNNNNRDDFEEGFQFNINPGESSVYVASLNSCIAVESFTMKEIPGYKFSIAGKVTNVKNGQLVGGITVAVRFGSDVSKDNLLSMKIGGNKFANYFIKDVKNESGTSSVWISAVSPEGCKLNYKPGDELRGELEIGKDIVFNQELEIWLGIVDIEMDCGDKYIWSVKENNSGKSIPGAKIELGDPGVSFSLTATTGADGLAVIDPGRIVSYCSKRAGDSLYRLIVKISASGHISKVVVADLSFCGSAKEPKTFFLDKAVSSVAEAVLLGRVIDTSGETVNGAKVNLYNFPPADLPYRTATSDRQGSFKMTPLEAKRFIVSAYHTKYAETETNRQVVELSRGEQAYVELVLRKVSESENFSVAVLRSRNLEPIEGAKVTLKEPAKPLERENSTNFLGEAGFGDVWVGQDLEIRIEVVKKSGGILKLQRTIKIPKNWNELSLDEQGRIRLKFIFVADDGVNAGVEESEVLVKVADSVSSTPISGASVKINLDWFVHSGLLTFTAVTDDKGEAVFPRDFSISDPAKVLPSFDPDARRAMNQFKILKGDSILLSVEKAGYEEAMRYIRVGLRRKIVEVKLVSSSVDDHILAVCLSDPSSANLGLRAAIETDQIKIEKKQEDGRFAEVFTYSDADSFISEKFECAAFNNPERGEYRASLANGSFSPSSSVRFSGKKDEVIFYNICGIEQKDLKKYSNDIYFVFQGDREQQLYEAHKNSFNELGKIIEKLWSQSKALKPVVISVGEFGTINAFASQVPAGKCGGLDDPTVIHVATELIEYFIGHGRADIVGTTIAHEYGHYIQYDFSKTKRNFSKRWDWLFEQIISLDDNLQQCVWGAVKDGNVGIAPYGLGGHPEDNPSEIFASFYSAFFMQHTRLFDIINSNLTEGSACQNIIKYMWQLFSENVGKVYPDDNSVFKPVGGRVGTKNYTWRQIIAGKWTRRVYDKLGLMPKARVQFEQIVIPKMERDVASLRQAIEKFNDLMDSIIRKLGIRDVGNVEGVVKDAYGDPIPRIVVNIGPKTALTDGRGGFRINNIPAGENKIVIKKPSGGNYQVVSPDPAVASIIKNSSAMLRIRINR
ncbi:MAG: carboxypeptidase regulatory-like domain-containing protein [Candidatus Berkelbacteria bacterium]|nr:carboxypeptidase regulatory-like domain-containing protein [Candidatus Berkelbacteria bacterium]